jgi:hypothetical protein
MRVRVEKRWHEWGSGNLVFVGALAFFTHMK